MNENVLYHQIGLLQQELDWCRQALENTTADRNKYRSQALMRNNKIQELQNELQKVYQKESN